MSLTCRLFGHAPGIRERRDGILGFTCPRCSEWAVAIQRSEPVQTLKPAHERLRAVPVALQTAKVRPWRKRA